MELCSFISSPIRIDLSRKQNLTLSVQNTIDSIGINGSSGYDRLYEVEVSQESKITKTQANAFYNCTSLSSANLQTVNSLGSGTFWNCSNLKSLTLGNVTQIPDSCFVNCISYSDGNWNNVTSLGDYAFSNTAIQTLQIPSVVEIGEYCFSNSMDLQTIYCTQQDSVSLESSNSFNGIKSDYTVWVKNEAYRDFYIQDSVWKTISSHISSVTQPIAKFIDGETVYKWETLNYNMDAIPPAEQPTKTGYTFVNWGDYTYITGDIDISATWTPHQWHLYLSASPIAGGTVSGEGLYDFDSTHKISAFPSLGYKLTKWSDNNNNAIRDYKLTNDCDVTLSALFDYITYTVNFNANGGSGNKPSRVCTYNTRYRDALLNNPTSDGYSKNGYYVDHWDSSIGQYQTTDDIYNWSATDSTTITLSANWSKATYKATLSHAGGTSTRSAFWWKYDTTTPNTYYYDSGLTLPVENNILDTLPSRGGYTFTGYKNGNTVYVISSGLIQNDLYKKYEDLTLTATWNPNEYQPIIAGGEGGTAGLSPKYTVSTSSQTKVITLPTRTNYHISGWTASGYKPDGSTAPTIDTNNSLLTIPANCYESFTMSPSWAIDKQKFTIYAAVNNSNYGTALIDNSYTSRTVYEDTSHTWTASSKTGYHFVNWDNNTSKTSTTLTETITGNTTHTAYFAANILTVYYSANGGSGAPSSATFTYGSSLTAAAFPSNMTKTGYTVTFDANGGSSTPSSKSNTYNLNQSKSWNASSSGNSTTYTPGTSYTAADLGLYSGSKTLYAIWGELGSITLPTSSGTRNGYTLFAWTSTKDSYSTSIGLPGDDYTPAKNFTAYAFWKPNALTLQYNGGYSTGGTPPNNQTYDYDTQVTIQGCNTLVRNYTLTCDYNYTGSTQTVLTSNYTFNNWNSKQDGSGTTLTTGSKYTNPCGWMSGTNTIYAQWTDGAVSLPTLSRIGYTSNGWWTEKSGGTQLTGKQYPTSNKTIYAHWTANTYTIKFNANGGLGTMGDQTCTYDQSYNLNANTFEYEGRTFNGWAETESGAKVYDDKAQIKNLATSGTKNLYACWTINTYQATYYTNF